MRSGKFLSDTIPYLVNVPNIRLAGRREPGQRALITSQPTCLRTMAWEVGPCPIGFAPIPDHALFKHAVFQSKVRDGSFMSRTRHAAASPHLCWPIVPYLRPNVVSRPQGTPSTNCNKGSLLFLRAGTSRQRYIRRAGHPARS